MIGVKFIIQTKWNRKMIKNTQQKPALLLTLCFSQTAPRAGEAKELTDQVSMRFTLTHTHMFVGMFEHVGC